MWWTLRLIIFLSSNLSVAFYDQRTNGFKVIQSTVDPTVDLLVIAGLESLGESSISPSRANDCTASIGERAKEFTNIIRRDLRDCGYRCACRVQQWSLQRCLSATNGGWNSGSRRSTLRCRLPQRCIERSTRTLPSQNGNWPPDRPVIPVAARIEPFRDFSEIVGRDSDSRSDNKFGLRQDSTQSNQIDTDDQFDPELLELPTFDSGVPIDPETLTDPAPKMLPAPGLPEPPGKQDTTIPSIESGEILPPPVGGKQDESDLPGKIVLPDSVSTSSGMPEKLKIHPSLSSGVSSNGKSNKMKVVINVVDHLGRTVNLDQFDIDADLSVVLLDPERESSEARIGRWDFSSKQLAQLIKREPISGLHVPIQWVGDRPTGTEVVVHVRLRAEEEDMRCEGRLSVEKQKTIAEWTPRGGEDVRR